MLSFLKKTTKLTSLLTPLRKGFSEVPHTKERTFPFNPLYFQRQVALENKEGGQGEDEAGPTMSDLKILPVYMNCLETGFTDRIFSICLNVVFYNIFNRQRSDETDAIYKVRDELVNKFCINIPNIEKLNTMSVSMKKFFITGAFIPDEYRTAAALHILKIVKGDKYNFLDQGANLGYTIRVLQRIGFKDEAVTQEFCNIICQNIKKIRYDFLLGTFSALSKNPSSISKENLDILLKEFDYRLLLLDMEDLTKLLDSTWNIFINLHSQNKSKEIEDCLHKASSIIKRVIELEIQRNRPFSIKTYASFIFLMYKNTQIRAEYSSAWKIDGIIEALERYWQQASQKLQDLKSENLEHLKRIGESISNADKYELSKYFPEIAKIHLIESLVKTYDQYWYEINSPEVLDSLLGFLEKNKELIQRKKLDTSISPSTYAKFLDIVFGDATKLSMLTKK